MLLKINEENPGLRNIRRVAEILSDDGVIICPTDTVYCFACDIYSSKAIERLSILKNIDVRKSNFSIAYYDLSHVSDFTRHIETPVFRLLKKALPGPFTFILPANNQIPKIFKSKKKTIGIRIPDNNITREIIKELGHPIVTTSIHDSDKVIDYITDPEVIYEQYKKLVDAVIDGGFGRNKPSTVVDCSAGSFEIIRHGLGDLNQFL